MKPSSTVIKIPAEVLYTASSVFTSLHGQINSFVPLVLGWGSMRGSFRNAFKPEGQLADAQETLLKGLCGFNENPPLQKQPLDIFDKTCRQEVM